MKRFLFVIWVFVEDLVDVVTHAVDRITRPRIPRI